jgi:predicted amidohydrolase
MNICLIQSNPELQLENVRSLGIIIQRIPAGLYVLPELFTTGMERLVKEWPIGAEEVPGGLICRKILGFVHDTEAVVVCGVLEHAGNDYHNTALALGHASVDRYHQKYPARSNSGRLLQIIPGDCKKIVLPALWSMGMMICADYFAAEDFFAEYSRDGCSCIIFLADSNSKKWMQTFPALCRKYKLPIIACNNAGTGKGGSCIFNGDGEFVTLRTPTGAEFKYLPEDVAFVAVGALEMRLRVP